jgi:hypothetical protein
MSWDMCVMVDIYVLVSPNDFTSNIKSYLLSTN